MTNKSPFLVVPPVSTPQPLQAGEIAHVWTVEKSLVGIPYSATKSDNKMIAKGNLQQQTYVHIDIEGQFERVPRFHLVGAVHRLCH